MPHLYCAPHQNITNSHYFEFQSFKNNGAIIHHIQNSDCVLYDVVRSDTGYAFMSLREPLEDIVLIKKHGEPFGDILPIKQRGNHSET